MIGSNDFKIQTFTKYTHNGFRVFKNPVNNKWEIWRSKDYFGSFDTRKLSYAFIDTKLLKVV